MGNMATARLVQALAARRAADEHVNEAATTVVEVEIASDGDLHYATSDSVFGLNLASRDRDALPRDVARAIELHRQRNFQVVALATQADMRFAIYQRQNLADEADFSCGIRYCPLGAAPIVLARYNGGSHIHGDIAYRPHIHSATAAALSAGRMPESEASETNRYTTLEGALACLLEDYRVTGVGARPDHPRLIP